MPNENPLNAQIRQNLKSKIDLLEKSVKKLRESCTIQDLENLLKELRNAASNSKIYGYFIISDLCTAMELGIIADIKNFYFWTPNDAWFESLEEYLKKMKEAFESHTPTTPASRENKEKKRVVIVDDDEDITKLLDYEFREIGFETAIFHSGGEALAFLLTEENLDDVFLLILDRMLPDMDGLDILKEFMKRFQIKVPVLILSSLDSETDIIEGLQSGAVDYITKPFSVFMLMQKALNLMKTQSR